MKPLNESQVDPFFLSNAETKTQTKESPVQHTQGEWKVSYSKLFDQCWITDSENESIAMMNGKNEIGDAEYLVKCVNQHEQLVKSNKDLVAALQEALPELIWMRDNCNLQVLVIDKIESLLQQSSNIIS